MLQVLVCGLRDSLIINIVNHVLIPSGGKGMKG